MPIRAEDLPPHLRAQLGLKGRSKPSRAMPKGSVPYRCGGAGGCGETFPDYASADKHADTGHLSARLVGVVQEPDSPAA